MPKGLKKNKSSGGSPAYKRPFFLYTWLLADLFKHAGTEEKGLKNGRGKKRPGTLSPVCLNTFFRDSIVQHPSCANIGRPVPWGGI